jgi:uncharacterized NAD-dependent epimerase/dehydratase family protein
VPLDAVVADFMAGSIEWLTPDNDPDHWDLIEGQGSLFHVSYSGVTLALIHGGQPDALVLCHEPTRPHMRGLPGYKMPSLEELRDLSLRHGADGQPGLRGGGVSINTAGAARGRGAGEYLAETSRTRMGLPTTDPVPPGAGPAGGRAGMGSDDARHAESFRLAEVFTISRGSRTEAGC